MRLTRRAVRSRRASRPARKNSRRARCARARVPPGRPDAARTSRQALRAASLTSRRISARNRIASKRSAGSLRRTTASTGGQHQHQAHTELRVSSATRLLCRLDGSLRVRLSVLTAIDVERSSGISSHRQTMGSNLAPDLLPGTLELLILKTVAAGPQHGYGIAQRLRTLSTCSGRRGSLYRRCSGCC